ncbi:calcium-activated chloride channel regulator 1-like [Toxorhynchites rutilus septentrionalis]|uniref:calcium-activated chloride channel regulator 1-like n=1 Tax=Toxorhynchites rutilus septentrionalis TaxID=329112 RepID=UPI00247B28B6|nr:calcium-activated chloride channel regulator 1-like [Toxorhynchites rutilus septentrionalis]
MLRIFVERLAAMLCWLMLVSVGVGAAASTVSSVYVEKSAYKNVVIEIRDNVPVENCQTILHNVEIMLTSASQYLFSALDGRLYFGDITIILPPHWPNSCIPYNQTRTSASGERSDVTVKAHSKMESPMWTKQFAGCGEAGDQIYIDADILGRDTIGREFVREWAKYRYGVFDEIGFAKDPVYPRCYINDDHELKLTGCSDAPVHDRGLCGNPGSYNISDVVDRNARSSIMFAAEAPSVSMFCDEGTHNRYAPTKQNQLCDRRSTLDVILKHDDFIMENQINTNPSIIVNTTPKFSYKTRKATRYVIIIDETLDMQLRESWSFLRSAMRKWVVHDLPANTEVGMVLANDTATEKMLQISSLYIQENKDLVASFIPYSPSDSRQPACLTCAVTDAIHMLNERTRMNGPANSIILIIAPGMEYSIDHTSLANAARSSQIRISTINYPNVIRRQPLDALAIATGGFAYSAFESKYNLEKSFLTTYFELSNTLFNIGKLYYEGHTNDLPIEIYRRQLVDSEDADSANFMLSKRTSRTVTGSFTLDSFMGPPAYFFVYVHNPEYPLIASMKLTSPSGIVYSSRSDARSLVKQLMVSATLNETGTWNYKIDRFNGNPQPHFVQVIATPRSKHAPTIQARSWIQQRADGPPIIYAEVRKGDLPIMGAHVEVVVSRPDGICPTGSGNDCQQRFRLLDSGSGDPDITRNDGIYSRYFNADDFGGAGAYQFEVTATDNDNMAYTRSESVLKGAPARCCGSSVRTTLMSSIVPFQRTLQTMTVFLSQDQLDETGSRRMGKISDLTVDVEGMKIRLNWTTPDMGGRSIARYEIKYATSIRDIVDYYDTASFLWHHDTPLIHSIGEESTFTMNMSHEPHLIGQVLYFAVRAHALGVMGGATSNYVRVFIPKPKRATSLSPTTSIGTESYGAVWNSYDEIRESRNHRVSIHQRIADTISLEVEVLVAIIAGTIFLIVVILICCYLYFVKKRNSTHEDDQKRPIKPFPNETKTALGHNVFVTSGNVTSSSSNTTGSTSASPDYVQQTTVTSNIPTIYSSRTLPIEQKLIEEMKQQQITDTQSFIVAPNDVINYNASLSRSYKQPPAIVADNRTLSPFESWSASQLLQEHEQNQRRRSPSLIDNYLDNDVQQFYASQHDQMSLLSSNPPLPPPPVYSTANTPYFYDQHHMHQHQPPLQPPQQYSNEALNPMTAPLHVTIT